MAGDAGHADSRKSAGGKDRQQGRRNAHLETRLPDTKADQAREDQIRQDVRKRLSKKYGGTGRDYPAEVVEKVLELRRKGFPISEMAKIDGMPSDTTIRTWKRTDPQFEEDFAAAFLEYLNERAEEAVRLAERITEVRGLRDEVLELSESMTKIKGLQGKSKANVINDHVRNMIQHATRKADAIDKRIARTLQAAAARMPSTWGRNADDERQVIVLEVGMNGWDSRAKTAYDGPGGDGDPGGDGQGPDAKLARERWRKIREVM